jgi:hypothetical protein
MYNIIFFTFFFNFFFIFHICYGYNRLITIFFFRVRAYGPGIEPNGPVVGAPANFTVETFSAGKGQVEVAVENPAGKLEPVRIIYKMKINMYDFIEQGFNKSLYYLDR